MNKMLGMMQFLGLLILSSIAIFFSTNLILKAIFGILIGLSIFFIVVYLILPEDKY